MEAIAALRLVFASFPPEWADPTNKVVRVMPLALALVVATRLLNAAQPSAQPSAPVTFAGTACRIPAL